MTACCMLWVACLVLCGCGLSAGGCLPRRHLLQSAATTPTSAVLPTGADSGPLIETLEVDRVQRDCIVFRNRYYDVAADAAGQELVDPKNNLQPEVDGCCRSCHAHSSCNVWQWCPDTSGCGVPGLNITFPYQGCQLLDIVNFSPYAQGNLTAVTGPAVPFLAGGAVSLTVWDASGYESIPGSDFGGKFDYPCSESEEEGRCMIHGPLEATADACTADRTCEAFVYFPEGIDFSGPALGILKRGPNGAPLSKNNTALNPSAASYFKQSQGSEAAGGGNSSSSSSSSGSSNTALIAGLVGGLLGFLLLGSAAAAAVYVKRRRAQQRLVGPGSKREDVEEEVAPCSQQAAGGVEKGGSEGSSATSIPPPMAAQQLTAVVGAGPDCLEPSLEPRSKQGLGQSLQRSYSPPSVVDVHLQGLQEQQGPAAAFPPESPTGSRQQQAQLQSHEDSPFMMFDEATIAAMQAAAPGLADIEPPQPPPQPKLPSWLGGGSGMPSSHHAAASSLGMTQQLYSGGTAGTAGTTLTASSHLPAGCSAAGSVRPLSSGGSVRPLHSGGGSVGPAELPRFPPHVTPPIWEEVVVAQLSASRAGAAGLASIQGNSLPASGTARELLEAFSKLYRQRPQVDYGAMAAMLEEADGGHGQGGNAGSASVSPQPTLEQQQAEQQGGSGAAAGAAGGAELQQQQRRRQQHDPGAAGTRSIVIDASYEPSLSLVPELPQLPWSDWALQPEEVEVCRRPDGSWWQLGSGACGTVYKGLYHGMQPVAVKVLHQREDDRRSDVFMREVTMLKGLRDRNIVQFLGASLEGASAMLVTEFMELGDLWRALPLKNAAGERVFGWYRRGRRVALDVARGLHYLHFKRIVHLDLKSANILLSRHGTAKIGDIGMARVLNRDYLTVLSGLGTFAWSAPEVLSGRRCTEKVDCFSFGIVLWEICTGEVPVRGDMRPLQVPQDCPQAVVELYARCTSESPEERPTAREIVELLSALPAA